MNFESQLPWLGLIQQHIGQTECRNAANQWHPQQAIPTVLQPLVVGKNQHHPFHLKAIKTQVLIKITTKNGHLL